MSCFRWSVTIATYYALLSAAASSSAHFSYEQYRSAFDVCATLLAAVAALTAGLAVIVERRTKGFQIVSA